MAFRQSAARLSVAPLVAVVAIAWLALLAGPVDATRGSTRLSEPDVSPRSGTTRTVVSFTVVYRNREGSPPDWVRVTVAGATHAMRPLDPLDQVKDGVRYSFKGRLPVGTHSVTFTSRGRDKFEDALAGGKVTIKAASTGGSGGGGSSGSGGGGSGGSGGSSPGSGSGGSGGSNPGAGSGGDSSPGGGSAPAGGSPSSGEAPIVPILPAPVSAVDMEPDDSAPGGSPDGTGAPAQTGGGPEPAAPGGLGIVPRGGGGPGEQGSLGAPRIPGVDLPGERIGRLLPMVVLTSVLTTLVMAFLIFGKRRRDEEPPVPEAELARDAALPYPFAAARTLAYAPAGAARSAPAFDPGTGGTDVDLPRWRRPSLLAARKYDPLRDRAATANLTFESHGEPGGARERRLVRYRVVRLLDRPDEMLGVELGTLDEGDEVEILEHRGTYRRVLTPDGREGWVHKMTLGDLVGNDGAPVTADSDIDADVLLAYLAARARG